MKSQSQGSSGVICCQVNSVARGGIWTCMFSSAVLFWLLPFDNHRKSLYLCLSHGMDARRLKPQDYPVFALAKCLTLYKVEQLDTVLLLLSTKADLHKEKSFLVPRNFSHLFSGSLKLLWKDLSLCGLYFKL